MLSWKLFFTRVISVVESGTVCKLLWAMGVLD
jgi:hypothetical protein